MNPVMIFKPTSRPGRQALLHSVPVSTPVGICIQNVRKQRAPALQPVCSSSNGNGSNGNGAAPAYSFTQEAPSQAVLDLVAEQGINYDLSGLGYLSNDARVSSLMHTFHHYHCHHQLRSKVIVSLSLLSSVIMCHYRCYHQSRSNCEVTWIDCEVA
jgi:hypothetical protein